MRANKLDLEGEGEPMAASATWPIVHNLLGQLPLDEVYYGIWWRGQLMATALLEKFRHLGFPVKTPFSVTRCISWKNQVQGELGAILVMK